MSRGTMNVQDQDESSSYHHITYNDNDESGQGDGSSNTGLTKKSSEIEDEPAIADKETMHVKRWRFVLVIVLASVALAVCTGTYLFVLDESNNDYKLSFKLFANSIEAQLGHHVENIEEGLGNLGDTISASADGTQGFPFVTVDKFEVLGEHARARSRMEAISYAPLVTEDQRLQWQNFSMHNQDWIEASRATFLEHNDIEPIYLPGKVSPWIYRRRDDIFPEEVTPHSHDTIYTPVWQLSPPPFNPAIVNFDMMSNPEYQEIIQHVITNKEARFSPVIDIERSLSLQVSDKDHLLYHEQFIDVEAGTGYDRPHTTYMQPIFKSRNADTVTGILVGVLAWDVYLADLVPKGVNGMIAVIQSTCGKASTYTYELNGAKPTFLGKGDLHNPSFNKIVRHVRFFGSSKDQTPWVASGGDTVSSIVCRYWVDLYPSSTFKNAYRTHLPIIAAATVAGTFLIVALIFWVYDLLVGKRYAKVAAAAKKSTAVVNSLFPAEVRDRIMEVEARNNENSALTSLDSNGDRKKARIADLFPDVTVLFCDIVGFTAWSSMREPCQVFELLETIYCEFDKIARRRQVFKVETIGDCYVACAGVPKPCKEHAVVMTRFARDCIEAFAKLVKELEISLGPDTGDLGVRIGLHSGPVTAGVLRGDRARFQLFGDAMNTASRIESNGMRNRIHCSEETANLLIAAGKKSWLTTREDKIHAKGKGELQTYWIEPRLIRRSSGSGSSGTPTALEQSEASESSSEKEGVREGGGTYVEVETQKQRLCSKTQRLIDWNTELLEKLMKKIVARHASLGIKKSKISPKFEAKGNPLDEVVEIIALPEFDSKSELYHYNDDNIQIPYKTVEELRAFVSGIAAMYNENPFHSFEHASHVTMSVSKLMSRIIAPSEVFESDKSVSHPNLAATLHDHTYGITSDPLTQFACLISALIHDVDHQGVPNTQLAKEKTLVASAYSTSPAEQNSIDLAWTLLMEDQFQNLRDTICPTPEEFARFRQLVVNAVMATDIMDKDLKVLRNARWESAFTECNKNEDPRDIVNRKATIVIEHLIQASDVAHTMQHWHIYRKWNERFFMECYAAYRNGRAEKDPSENWYQGEIGFFDFYIIPLAKKLKDCGVFGVSSDEYLKYAVSNRNEWESRGKEIVACMLARVKGG